MIKAAFEVLGQQQIRGIAVALRGERNLNSDRRIQTLYASHPIPNSGGLKAAMTILRVARAMKRDELLLCLISGGASAMLPSPPPGISLEEEQQLTRDLLRSKATIHETNTVRRHISTMKGGRLVEQCKAATILSLIVSDVPGNHLTDIASGLTVEDPTTFLDAVDVLKHYNLWDKTPYRIKKYLNQGVHGRIPETPKPGTAGFRRVRNIIIADNIIACTAARQCLKSNGIEAKILATAAEMQARQMGRLLASLALGQKESEKTVGPQAIIIGGETTVDVKGKGKGGRNQETVLWATEGIGGLEGTVVCALGTDGIDGNSNAAGAVADGKTANRAKRKRLNVNEYLALNDSYRFFKSLNDGLITGRTGTNVGDLYLMVSL